MIGAKMLRLSFVVTLICALTGVFAIDRASAAGGDDIHIEKQPWTFSGMFGYYDQAQLQRGFQVYKQVCATCHSMKLMHYRNLGEKGGTEFEEKAVRALSMEATVIDGPNEQGEMFDRPGKPSDKFASPFKNDKEAAVANNGAVPPDLSVIAKARGVSHSTAFYLEPLRWISEILTNYQEGGADYIYALLTGYSDPPANMTMAEGMNYNSVFPGHQIAMPQPITDDAVEYSDGTPQTVAQHSKDVTAFLMWAAEPHLEARKQLGFRVLIYLSILALLFYLVKLRVWKRVEH